MHERTWNHWKTRETGAWSSGRGPTGGDRLWLFEFDGAEDDVDDDPFVESVLRESPIGEHATNGVAESAMREMKRQTRTLKIALEAHVVKIVEPHSILKWIPTMAADAISFFRIGKDGLTDEMRRSGRAWKKLVAEFGRSVYYRAVARAVASGMQPSLHVGRYFGHHARTGSVLIMTTEGVVKAAGFRWMNEEN